MALHAGALALVLVVISRDQPLPALTIDLRDPFVPGASVATPPREERSASSSAGPRSNRSRPTVPEKTAAVTPEPTPPAPSAPPVSGAPATAPGPSPAPVIEAAPPPPSLVSVEAPRELAPAALQSAPSSGEVVEPRRSGSPAAAAAATAEPNPRAAGGSTGASSGGGTAATGHRGMAGDGSQAALAPSGGAGSGAGAEYGPYLTALRQRIQESVRYPSSARRRGLAGTVSVEILILANGTIGDVTLLESSTHAVLDDAALETIRALPRVPLPPGVPARPLRVRVPVVFQMR